MTFKTLLIIIALLIGLSTISKAQECEIVFPDGHIVNNAICIAADGYYVYFKDSSDMDFPRCVKASFIRKKSEVIALNSTDRIIFNHELVNYYNIEFQENIVVKDPPPTKAYYDKKFHDKLYRDYNNALKMQRAGNGVLVAGVAATVIGTGFFYHESSTNTIIGASALGFGISGVFTGLALYITGGAIKRNRLSKIKHRNY
jgi:hypothetical protein